MAMRSTGTHEAFCLLSAREVGCGKMDLSAPGSGQPEEVVVVAAAAATVAVSVMIDGRVR